MSEDDISIVEALEYYLTDIPENYLENDLIPVRIPVLRKLLRYFKELESEEDA